MNIDYIINRIPKKEDILLIEKAYNLVNEKILDLGYQNRNELINNILEVTNTLIDFNADSKTLISSILYTSIKYGITKEKIEEEFGKSIASIVYKTFIISNQEEVDKEIYIKSLDELNNNSEEDVRTLFIMLAKSYYKMNMIKNLPIEYQKKVASDTLNILVPTASRLRLNYIKSKIEDLCLFYLEPIAYHNILNKLGDTPENLKIYLNDMKENISKILTENNIKFVIKSRVKNIYSINNKLSSGRTWESIYDILAIRILVDNEYECQLVADLIHSRYIFVSERLKNFIKNPKDNMYQSLHTTIIGDDNRFYEIQIRTHKMNKIAEIGQASHYLYKRKQLKKINNK